MGLPHTFPFPQCRIIPLSGLIVTCAKPYLSVTAIAADPPKLLRTVTFLGFVDHDNRPLKLPAPLFVNRPIKAPVAVT